ncbi:MAG: L-serine ammonia-lyase, iron-sulfur-dependent, subunit alpha [Fusobacterium sp.]
MDSLIQMIQKDMKPAFGVTEPGSIALAVSTARKYSNEEIQQIKVLLNSGIYKNGFTCGIPNSDQVGNAFAAALGVVAGNPEKGLESLIDVTERDNKLAQKLIDEHKIKIILGEITSDIYIEATLITENDIITVLIEHSHENIVKITKNNNIIFEKDDVLSENSKNSTHLNIHDYTLKDIIKYVENININELNFIKKAYDVNLELFNEGMENTRTTFCRNLFKLNNEKIISEDVNKTANLLCGGAIEARVIGLNKAAMSITGSGAHGIIATMPLYAEYKVNKMSEEKLLRGTALSYLICTYIKEYSGKLSAFCGCAIAAGTGMACAITFMRNGSYKEIVGTLNNMASSITGMICDGGNQGCTMKGIVATDAAFRSVELAMNDSFIFNIHGICDEKPENTMRNMGLIASPGMVGTEKTIVEIFNKK